jgi:hypothetical protein
VSAHAAYRRQPVPGNYAQALKTVTLPAPTRGLVQHENDAYIGPGAAIVSDNWFPTMKGVKLRGGCARYATLPEAVPVISSFEYVDTSQHRMFAAQATKVYDVTTGTPVEIASGRTSGNYVASPLANQGGYWMLVVNDAGDPVLRYNGTTWTSLSTASIGAWTTGTSYAVGNTTKDTADGTFWRCLIAHTSPGSGTFAAARAAAPTQWASSAADGASWITGPVGSPVEFGHNLTYVCKYRNRLFFIEKRSMNVWYLAVDAVGGLLTKIPMSGAATRGGYLMFMSNWSIDAGDGIDDKLVVVTSEGEALIWTGNNPGDSANWRQEGRYFVGKPLGMNAHEQVGGDLLILTVEGVVPMNMVITKSAGEMELAMVSRAIKRMWREEVAINTTYPWTIRRWDEYGGIFITLPGGRPGNQYCLAMNSATGAFARGVGWDALCFLRQRANMFFGTRDGRIMQMERTGSDDGLPYVATLVGGWEMFQARSQTVHWRQARAIFTTSASEPFIPQLDATTDYIVEIPPPPQPGPDPGPADVWDEAEWGPDMGGPPPPVPTTPQRDAYGQWDQPARNRPANRNTMWVSIGKTGFSHAPIVQVTVGQQAKPDVELVAIAAIFEVAGTNV